VLRGCVGEINKTAEKILSQKGVKLGRINWVPQTHYIAFGGAPL